MDEFFVIPLSPINEKNMSDCVIRSFNIFVFRKKKNNFFVTIRETEEEGKDENSTEWSINWIMFCFNILTNKIFQSIIIAWFLFANFNLIEKDLSQQ